MNYTLLVLQIMNITIIIMWIVLAIRAFNQMRHRVFSDMAHILWVAVIIFIPILGALAFLMTKPGSLRETSSSVKMERR
ncbi:MAG: hypothetical protein GFH27_549289n326 [Chloroflexi bacterium AL-W]|nr:hypothetical protein [Chloroflexi bacterium AL-N1]NOK67058.1 hypothetical protein [Chloroflexi bacterium AL-N10]NOK74650.1 hypothetical protein [Chloroflexi bacterium AL-N5]NOK81660.1 hypothetical protein [Chloroflexi bacterium AL-W]NOK89130.1 hypothetical protein [Chloroflexi bacterium AL-N15]